MQLLLCFITLLLEVSFVCSTDPPNAARAKWLSPTYSYAKCLDGSPPLYYYRLGSPMNRTKWIIHQQGGAWCTSLEDCYQRSLTRLGSSSSQYGWQPLMDFGTIPGCLNARWCGGLFVNDPSINPLTYDWNAVFIVYCDGGSQIGNNQTVTTYKNTNLHFKGSFILEAIITDLIKTLHLDQATEIIVGGDSAGGLSTFLHIDYWKQRLPRAVVTGVPDSGFFMENNNLHFVDNLKWVVQQMNGTSVLLDRCKAQYPSTPEECLFPQNMIQFINTNLFILQSKYDEYQINAILGNTTPDAVNAFGADMQQRLQSVISGHNGHGIFLDSCVHHCGGWGMHQDQDYQIVIDGDSGMDAFRKWYSHGTGKKMWIQQKSYPCTDCCNGGEKLF